MNENYNSLASKHLKRYQMPVFGIIVALSSEHH